MRPKSKAFLFNFLCFGLIFVLLRVVIFHVFFPEFATIFAASISGVVAIFLSPRFAALPTDQGEKLFVKWIFFRGIKKIGG